MLIDQAIGYAFMIKIKRVYEAPEPDDGHRFLVDRIWPRGVKKSSLKMERWFKNIAPSDTLRHWFGHDSARWEEFKRRYFIELDSKSEIVQEILLLARKETVTFLFSASDVQHNNAFALREYLIKLLDQVS